MLSKEEREAVSDPEVDIVRTDSLVVDLEAFPALPAGLGEREAPHYSTLYLPVPVSASTTT